MAVNEVRQILMNELGLTREGVRAEMRDIVRDCVDRHVGQLDLRTILTEQINKALRVDWSTTSEKQFKDAIKAAVAAEAVRLVEESMTISVTPK